jgi:protein SCO1
MKAIERIRVSITKHLYIGKNFLRATLYAAALAVVTSAAYALDADRANAANESVYQLNIKLQDQNGQTLPWSANKGRVRIVTMFYSSCPHTCPLTIESIKLLESHLHALSRERLEVDLISLDPDRDTPEKLKASAKSRNVDELRWHLYRTNAASVRQIAGLLGVQYRQLPDGEFNHSSILVLLDSKGRILAKSEQTGKEDQKFIIAVARALAR